MKYEELLPYQIDETLSRTPIAYLPWGALEWHGKHLAIGNDAIKAYELCLRICEKTGGVVLPAVFCGYHTMQLWDFPHTFEFKEETVRQLFQEYLEQLEKNGFKVAVVITGHYGAPHIKALKETAEKFQEKSHLKVWVLPEYEVVSDLGYQGDHAAKWETSILMYLRPELVDMSQLSPDLNVKPEGVGGEDPRVHASKDLGNQIVEAIVERIAKRARELLAEAKNS